MQPIEERITDIENLDRLRRCARALQEQAIGALTGAVYRPLPRLEADRAGWMTGANRDGWRPPGDDVEKAMMLQALLRLDATGAGRRGHQRESLENIRKDLHKITAEDCNRTKEADPSRSLDNVPVMRWAMVLRALASDGCALVPAAFACFSHIVLELNEMASPTWAVGTARASNDALASGFITGECALALLALERAMLRTAEAAELVAKTKRRVSELGSEIGVWRARELVNQAMALYASLNTLRPHLVVELSEGLIEPLRNLGNTGTDLAAELLSLIGGLETALSAALDGLPAAAAVLPAMPAFPTPDRVEQIITKELRTAAHNATQHIVTMLISALGAVGPERAATNLRKAAQVVRDLCEPIRQFAETTIDRELARPRLDLAVDAAELVFAACLLGRLSDWHLPKVRSAFRLARELMTPDGRLPSLQPFNVQGQGYRLNVATLEITRRLAELAAHVEVELDPAFVETLLRPFEDTRAPGQDVPDRGWMADPRRRDPHSEWWVTALAVDALGIVIDMLNVEINRQVLEQFHVRRPAEIGLDLDQLFYPDYGLTELKGDPLGRNRSVAVKLQQLRIHAGSGPPEAMPHYSLILYGPPGTGKTTLVEAIARSANVPLVEITPSDILVGGEEAIERRTRHVFLALSMLTNVVILFDEFDPILQDRTKRKGDEQPRSIFEFLTPGMLPKLKRLHGSAKDYRVSYVLATNFIYNLDPAVIRQGRFDDRHGIYPADTISRFGRLLDQLRQQGVTLDEAAKARTLEVVVRTASGAMDQIAKPGWYSAGRVTSGSAFGYISNKDNLMDPVQREADFNLQWRDFIKERCKSLTISESKIRDVMPEGEKRYWDDWSSILFWDDELAYLARIGVKFEMVGGLLDQWVKDRKARRAEPPS